jgi:hypothetical protein
MWALGQTAFHVGEGILGLILLYGGLVLHEDEERTIQNTLVESWVKISDMEKAALSWQVAFAREVARLTGESFARLFGPHLLSFRAPVWSC